MGIAIEPNGSGGYLLSQKLVQPVVYFDHWAVRLFSEDEPLQARFVDALHRAGGTLLFSTANLYEFIAMTDLNQAVLAERLLARALPGLYVVDTGGDRGFLLEEDAPTSSGAPPQHWLLSDLGERAKLAGGTLTTHRFVQDAIAHRDMLAPLFEQCKRQMSDTVMSTAREPARSQEARKFTPASGMKLRTALFLELIREAYVNPDYRFDDNDAMDLIHTIQAALRCDYALLDARWCHKVSSASKRLRRGGVTGRLAQCFSRKTVPDFLTTLEGVALTRR